MTTSSLIISYIIPTDSPASRFYAQSKMDKPGFPIRPIVLYSGSPLYNLNKYTANILKAENNKMIERWKNENNNAKNSTTFSNYIRNVPIKYDKAMVSFDVTSLYTNISIIDTLNIITDYVNNLQQYLRHYTLQKFGNDLLITLILFLNVRTWKTFSITSTIFIKILSLL